VGLLHSSKNADLFFSIEEQLNLSLKSSMYHKKLHIVFRIFAVIMMLITANNVYASLKNDVESDLCYNRFRWYSPEEGIYISQDPIGLEGSNPNFYAYVRDPNKFVDPFGLDELYALTAKKDGWYPVMEYGKKDPIGEVYLKKGDLWKIGTSKDASKRYTQKYLAGIGVQLDVLHTNISRRTSLFLENLKLKGYLAWKGFLPAGNKCKH
jgi:RHS repeat-associated protein